MDAPGLHVDVVGTVLDANAPATASAPTAETVTVAVDGVTWTKEQQTTEPRANPRMVWLRPVSLGYRLAEDCSPDLTPYLDRIADLERELGSVDSVLARRPALADYVTRGEKIERAINVAKQVDDLTRQLQEAQLREHGLRAIQAEAISCAKRVGYEAKESTDNAPGSTAADAADWLCHQLQEAQATVAKFENGQIESVVLRLDNELSTFRTLATALKAAFQDATLIDAWRLCDDPRWIALAEIVDKLSELAPAEKPDA